MKIPEGWFRLPADGLIKKGDKFLSIRETWLETTDVGLEINSFMTYIRKIPVTITISEDCVDCSFRGYCDSEPFEKCPGAGTYRLEKIDD